MLQTQMNDTKTFSTPNNEVLNIDFHKKRLIAKAIEKYPRKLESAAKELGISLTTLFRHKKRFGL